MGSSPSSPANIFYFMNNKILSFLLFAAISWLGFVLYNNASVPVSEIDVSEMETKIKDLNQALLELTEDYEQLKKALPVPVEEQLVQIKNKVSELDSLVTDQSDLLKKVDPNGIIQDTENWISDSYTTALDSEESGWSRARAASILSRFGRMDEKVYNDMADLYLSSESDRLKAQTLGVIKDDVTQELKDPLMEKFSELMKDGEFKNGWLMGNIIEASKNLVLSEEDKAKFLYVAQNHPDDRIAKNAARVIGIEVESIE